jgi:hypothetical protein
LPGSLLFYRIVSAGIKGIAPKNAKKAEPDPLDGAVPFYGHNGIFGACGIKAASLRKIG